MQCKTKLLRLVRVKDSTVQESKDSTGQEQKKAQYNYKSEKEHSVRVKERGMRIISNTRPVSYTHLTLPTNHRV